MADTVTCNTHGDSAKAYVCTHLVGEQYGLGFNREEPDTHNPFPDAWCDACEAYRVEHNGWNEESEKYAGISLICSECYLRAHLCNQKTAQTLDELASLRWKCGSCEEWHIGPMLDIGWDRPRYWPKDRDAGQRWIFDIEGNRIAGTPTFLDSDYCAIDDEFFFVRGLLHLPIIGAGNAFRLGIWGSLSIKNFEALIKADAGLVENDFDPMFSWLSSQIDVYPDSESSLKMHAHIQAKGLRPNFALQPADHLLARDYQEGITVERLKKIMFHYLPAQGA